MDANESDNARQPQSHVVESNEGTNRKSKPSWGISTAVYGVGFVAKKVISNRVTDSLWHSKKGGSSGSNQSDHDQSLSCELNPKIDDPSREAIDEHTYKSPVNIADEETPKSPVPSQHVNEKETSSNSVDKSVIDPSENSQSPNSCSIDTSQLENTKATNISHVKQVNQHRWPSTSSGSLKSRDSSHARFVNQHRWPSATGSNVNPQSDNLKHVDGSHGSLVNQHRWPGTIGSNVLHKNIDHTGEANKVQGPSSPNKSYGLAIRGVSPSRTRTTTPTLRGASVGPSIGIKASPTIRGASLIPSSKSVKPKYTTKWVDPPKEMDPSISHIEIEPSLVTKEVSPSSSPKEVSPIASITMSSPTSPTKEDNSTPIARSISPPPNIHTPTSPSSQSQPDHSKAVFVTIESDRSPTKEIDYVSSRDVSATPSRDINHSVSPTHAKGVGHGAIDANPNQVKQHTARRHFFNSHIFSIFSKMTDTKKEKNVSNHKDDAQHLELLYNIQVQWQFANASLEAALNVQRATAEQSLYDVWITIFELRDSIAAKKIEHDFLILQLKLYAILYRQMAYMDEWGLIQSEYESALLVTTNDLQARCVSVPITDGVKADIRDLKLVLFSIGQVLQATVSCIHSTESKLDRTHITAAEVANVALHERALLDECEIFLASLAPLQIEECSLRSYLMQLNRTSMSE